jgi:tetratricopeptide (TPR) repeat protein
MKRTILVRLAAAALLALAAVPSGAEAPAASPAERSIEKARLAIAAAPRSPSGYNELALALARRARETSDPAFYARAHEAVESSLALAADNPGALRARAWVLLGQHDFQAALELARTLNKKMPDDVMVYAFLTDASVELGDYAEAEKACQWMLDLRPGNLPALTRAAYLRELFGDVTGALMLMNDALGSVPPAETEDRAWVLTQIAHLEAQAGRYEQAERALQKALASFPGYHYALGQLARVRGAQGRWAEAVELFQQRQQGADHPENLYELAEALQKAGRKKEAQAAFARFEAGASRERAGTDNANRELIFYYVDHARRPAEALRLAEAEVARRKDVYTRAAYAWALRANGRHSEAKKEMEAALAVGIRDPHLLRQAAAIAAKAGDRAAAARYRRTLQTIVASR